MSDSTNKKAMDLNQKYSQLIQRACELGASQARMVSCSDILVDKSLADLCRESTCANYGLSKSCPPHVAGPSAFKEKISKMDQALFFKIDLFSEILMPFEDGLSEESRAVFRLLHEIAAGVEKAAVEIGFADAQAYAGGSCKRIFCHAHAECQALSENGTCRNPEYARPSMSGFGIKVAKLFETCKWDMRWIVHGPDATQNDMTSICGLVLIH